MPNRRTSEDTRSFIFRKSSEDIKTLYFRLGLSERNDLSTVRQCFCSWVRWLLLDVVLLLQTSATLHFVLSDLMDGSDGWMLSIQSREMYSTSTRTGTVVLDVVQYPPQQCEPKYVPSYVLY